MLLGYLSQKKKNLENESEKNMVITGRPENNTGHLAGSATSLHLVESAT